MSAIGGMIDRKLRAVDARVLSSMSRSMLLRGRDGRFAYLGGGVGLFSNRTRREEPLAEPQPCIDSQESGICTAVVDGWIDGADGAARHLLACYRERGAGCAETLCGSFAAAICDEARGEVLLLRDRQGSRPLFCLALPERFVFASEIKGVLASLDEPIPIRRERLREHLLAPCGADAGEDLYESILCLPPAHAALYSPTGLSLLPLSHAEPPTACNTNGDAALPISFVCPDKENLRRILTEVLFAFDYPQFDVWMPALLGALATADTAERQIVFEDVTLWESIPYAFERADRLGGCLGLHAVPVVPSARTCPHPTLAPMAERMESLCAELDVARLRYLFGDGCLREIARQKNPARQIRMLGMLYQTLQWEAHYPIRWV